MAGSGVRSRPSIEGGKDGQGGGLHDRSGPIVSARALYRIALYEVPDRSEQIDAALLDVGRHPGMRRVEVAQSAVGVARENGNGGVLTTFAIFAA